MSYEWDLDIQLQTCVDMYRNARDKYWQNKLSAAEWSALKQLRADADEIAALIRKRATLLQNIGDNSDLNAIRNAYLHERSLLDDRFTDMEEFAKEHVPPHLAADFLRAYRLMLDNEQPDPEESSDRPLHLIWESLCIADAWDAVNDIRDRVRRILRLERLLADVLGMAAPPTACLEFLALVSRCYIFDFIPECIMVCRSAIEVALRQKITDQHCERAGQRRSHFGYDLHARIEAAFDPRNTLLDLQREKVVYDAATRVRLRGKKTVHEQVDVTKDALGTIRDALQLIDALSRLPDPS